MRILACFILIFLFAAFLPAQENGGAAPAETTASQPAAAGEGGAGVSSSSPQSPPPQGSLTDPEYISFLRSALDLQLSISASLREQIALLTAQIDALRKGRVDDINAKTKTFQETVAGALEARGVKGGSECVQLDGSIKCP